MATNEQFSLEKKMTSRLVLFVQEFNVEVDNILYFLVQDGVFKYNGSMFQQIMVSGTNIERFRRLMELVPKRENQQRKLLRAITSTDTFIRDREHFVKCFSKPPNPLHTNNILEPADWELADGEVLPYPVRVQDDDRQYAAGPTSLWAQRNVVPQEERGDVATLSTTTGPTQVREDPHNKGFIKNGGNPAHLRSPHTIRQQHYGHGTADQKSSRQAGQDEEKPQERTWMALTFLAGVLLISWIYGRSRT